MLLKDFLPAKEVAEFVQLYRIVHLQFEAGQIIPPKAYPPRPEQCLAFYPYDTETVQYSSYVKSITNLPVVVYGQFTEVTHRFIGNQFLVFQIVFNPGGLYKLTGIPSSEINNEYLDAAYIFSAGIHKINEQLYQAKNDYQLMVEIANKFVKELIKKRRKQTLPIDKACHNMLTWPNMFSLKWLANEACLSQRQLERIFKERTGVNPKLFSRIINFDKAFRFKNSNPNYDWLRIALACNYHDYQHLSKAYKDFTGLSPVAFHEVEQKAPERIVGLSEGYYT
jgi:AraC-like DNA-binding protein